MDFSNQQFQNSGGQQGGQSQGDQGQSQGGYNPAQYQPPVPPAPQPLAPTPAPIPTPEPPVTQVPQQNVPQSDFVPSETPMMQPQDFGGSQGGAGQGDDSKKDDKKTDLPEISDEEAQKFDMRTFDETLKPDLTTLSDDSLGKALGTQGKQYDGGHLTAAQQFEDICNTQIGENSLNFNPKEFLELLAGSISLMYAEKKAIIDQIPKLSQFQIDELLKILREEKKKFAALNKKHTEELKKIEAKHDNSEEKEKLHNEELSQRSADEEAAAELLRKLQGGN
jgi:hypothetical protein